VDEARGGQERGDVLVGVVQGEGPGEVDPVEVDVPGDVWGAAVDRAAQQHPPVQEVLEAAVQIEGPAGEPCHGCHLVAPQVRELLGRQPEPRAGARRTVEEPNRAVVTRQVPDAGAFDLDGERPPREMHRRSQQVAR
jgi:hypothetical protein